MGRKYKDLNEGERYIIEYMLRKKYRYSQIAAELGRAVNTIKAEVKRGSVEQKDHGKIRMVYYADAAQRKAVERRKRKRHAAKIDKNPKEAAILYRLIKENRWSPETAIAYAEKHKLIGHFVCFKPLYNYIEAGLFFGLEKKDLPMAGKRRRKARRPYRHAHRIIGSKSIDLRPAEVEGRETFGHWEGDLIVGPQGTPDVVLTLVERKTRFLIERRFHSKKSENTVHLLDELEQKIDAVLGDGAFGQIFKSITFDNGVEFADFIGLAESSLHPGNRCEIYYAHPFCSSERGTNERNNGMLRRGGIPKHHRIDSISDGQIVGARRWTNMFPRKILGWNSSQDLFRSELAEQFGDSDFFSALFDSDIA